MKPTLFFTIALIALGSFSPKSAFTQENPASDKVLWDEWYTITAKKKIPAGYYNERIETKKGRLFAKSDIWKKEEGYINRETLGAFSENNATVSPLFFNYHSTFRTTETSVDGNVQNNGKMLNVKIKRTGQELPVVQRGLPTKAIFAVFFPAWLGKQLPSLKEGRTLSFQAIAEDDLEHEFQILDGSVKLEKPDAVATKTKTSKVLVDYHGERTYWWVDSRGAAERIEMPSQDIVVERVPRAKAIRFLESEE